NGGVSDAPQPPPAADDPPVPPVLTPAQSKRANQSLKGMIISVLLTVAVAVPVIALNPAGNDDKFKPDVNVTAVASEAGQAADFTPVAARMPEGWYPNFARWISGSADQIDYWEVGYVTGDDGCGWGRQTADATPGGSAKLSEDATASGSVEVDGTTWDSYTRAAKVSWVRKAHGSTLMLSSESGDEVLREAARAVLEDQSGSKK
ncbi:MAG: DUF4245 domain-containing protein, partial [Micrococcaceae bacterium]|nr:DUF4245 domain-containing protein [Micrococcaceae bacterium]